MNSSQGHKIRVMGFSTWTALLGAATLLLLLATSITLMSAVLLSSPFEVFKRNVQFRYLLLLGVVVLVRILVMLRPHRLTIQEGGISIAHKRIPASAIDEVITRRYNSDSTEVCILHRSGSGNRERLSVRKTFFYVSAADSTSLLEDMKKALPSAAFSHSKEGAKRRSNRTLGFIIVGLILFNIALILMSRYGP